MAISLLEVDIDTTAKAVASSLGYRDLKKEQSTVINNFVSGNNVFAVLPTGFGKTLCYACLPSIFDQLLSVDNSVVIVLS